MKHRRKTLSNKEQIKSKNLTLLNNSLKQQSKPKKTNNMEIKYFTPVGEAHILTREAVEEMKLRECFEPTIRTTSYEIKPICKEYKCFEKYFKDITGQVTKIIFFNKIYPNSRIEMDFITKFLEKESCEKSKIIHKDSFKKQKLTNSAEFIAVIYS